MTPLDYEFLRKLLKDRSGLDLSADKQYLLESRLIPLARKAGVPGLPELVQKLKGGAEPLVNSASTLMPALFMGNSPAVALVYPASHFRLPLS